MSKDFHNKHGDAALKIDIPLEEQMKPEEDPARRDFLTRPLGGLIFRNTLPAVASMLFMALYHMADAIMVGRSLGPEALA